MIIRGCGRFTDMLWDSVSDIFKQIITHPFYIHLAEGNLSSASFRQYLEQDILYLKEDTRAISLTADAAFVESERLFFKKLATAGNELEKTLHKKLAEKFTASNSTEMNSACRAYSEYLVKTASEKSYEESAAALLPCYWVYQNAGILTAESSVPDNRYQAWLSTYSGKEFTAFTEEYIQIIEYVAARSDRSTFNHMADAFITAATHELSFISSIPL